MRRANQLRHASIISGYYILHPPFSPGEKDACGIFLRPAFHNVKKSYFCLFSPVLYRMASTPKSNFLSLLGEILLDLIFPKFCVACGKTGSFLCEFCFNDIHFYPLPLNLSKENTFLDEAIAAGSYLPPLSTLVTTLKYQSIKGIGIMLGKMLYHCVNFPQTDFITAIPIHPKRRKMRGFNQAEIIALEISRLSRVPYLPILIRTKHSKPQASLNERSLRLLHLKNTFALSPHLPNSLRGKSILLIDDVFTTGTTMNACAEILKQAGATTVIGLAVAHEA